MAKTSKDSKKEAVKKAVAKKVVAKKTATKPQTPIQKVISKKEVTPKKDVTSDLPKIKGLVLGNNAKITIDNTIYSCDKELYTALIKAKVEAHNNSNNNAVRTKTKESIIKLLTVKTQKENEKEEVAKVAEKAITKKIDKEGKKGKKTEVNRVAEEVEKIAKENSVEKVIETIKPKIEEVQRIEPKPIVSSTHRHGEY